MSLYLSACAAVSLLSSSPCCLTSSLLAPAIFASICLLMVSQNCARVLISAARSSWNEAIFWAKMFRRSMKASFLFCNCAFWVSRSLSMFAWITCTALFTPPFVMPPNAPKIRPMTRSTFSPALALVQNFLESIFSFASCLASSSCCASVVSTTMRRFASFSANSSCIFWSSSIAFCLRFFTPAAASAFASASSSVTSFFLSSWPWSIACMPCSGLLNAHSTVPGVGPAGAAGAPPPPGFGADGGGMTSGGPPSLVIV